MKRFMTVTAIVISILMLLAGCAGKAAPSGSAKADASEDNMQVSESTDAAEEQAESTAPASSLIEPDQLVSQQEAEALLGIKLTGKITENAVVGQKLCFYESADGSSDQYLQIGITQQAFMPEGSPNTPESLYQSICAAFEAKPVSSLGDEAQIIPSGYQIMSNGYYLTITAGYSKDDDSIMKAASEAAVKNLKALLGK